MPFSRHLVDVFCQSFSDPFWDILVRLLAASYLKRAQLRPFGFVLE